MSKSNKIRYKSRGNQFPAITMTGKVSKRKMAGEEPDVETPVKGDLQIFLSTDSLVYNEHVGDFESIGLEGYLKASVWDGKGWKPLSMEEFFPERDHYFSKRERPLDTYNMCVSTLKNAKGTVLARTYREHYRISVPGDSGNG